MFPRQNSQQRPQQPQQPESPRPRINWISTLIWLALGFVLLSWFWGQLGPDDTATQIAYTTFRREVDAGNVSEITVTGEQIQGQLVESISVPTDEGSQSVSQFITYLPAFGDDTLLATLTEQDVTVNTEPIEEFSWWGILLNFLPLLVLIGFFWFIMNRSRQQGQAIFGIGRSQAKLFDEDTAVTTFADVAGLEGAKVELREIIAYLKNPVQVERLGGEAPKGILLVGPPGTGKTLLARASAGEAGVPFFSITGSDFMEMFVGVGASRVRDLFDKARKAAPCIIFIDELDSIGRRRGAGLGGGHDEREQTLNQMLSELDGFDPSENVVVMAATNRPDILDPALLRPGRFDRRITVDLPTVKARQQILEIHAANKPLASDVELKKIAQGTPGFSGADLENLLNEAALLAARKDQDAITNDDVEDARDKILMGLVREGLALTDEECRLIAYHEAGHAILAALLPHADPIHKVTIVPRGHAMGVTQQLPEKEKYIYPREYLSDRLTVMMGGRAAEELVFDTATSGAGNDLKQASQLARRMVLEWGMSERLQHMALGSQSQQVFLGEEIAHRREYSEATAREVDEEVQRILHASFQEALETLQTHRYHLDELAEMLLETEEVAGDKVLALVEDHKEKAVV